MKWALTDEPKELREKQERPLKAIVKAEKDDREKMREKQTVLQAQSEVQR